MSLANLFQWSAQVVLVALAGAAVMRMIRLDAPVLRHAFWRILLIAVLVLPAIQPRTPPIAVAEPGTGVEVVPLTTDTVALRGVSVSPSLSADVRRFAAAHWTAVIGFVLAVGMAVRLIWLAAGILRLRRLCGAGRIAVPGGEYDDLAERIRARAEIRYVSRLGQPVTFGLFKPVVLLPETFPALPSLLQRTVLAHELWHIRRRDWGWVLIEETVRAVLWFNPAVSWIISRVQATREEVVDELTVQLTNARKAYLEALLTFADQPTLFPAAPLARRRHLFQRMLLISREAVMSSTRIVSSFAAAMAVVTGAGWYGAAMFPLSAAAIVVPAREAGRAAPPATVAVPSTTAATTAPPSQQAPTRDRRPGEPAPETAQERQLKQAIGATPTNRELYFSLASLQRARGAMREFEATLAAARRAFPNDIATLSMIAGAYRQAGRFDDAVAALQESAALDPANPAAHHLLAVHYWEKVFKDTALPAAQKLAYVQSGIAAADKALALNPDYVDALVYKNILLRMEANLDPVNAASLLAQADALRNRALELQRTRQPARGVAGGIAGGVPGGVTGGVTGGVAGGQTANEGAPPPPPPPPPPVNEATIVYPPPPTQVDGVTPVRIGGTIRPPMKIRDVKPIYPPIAQSARVQGVIIIEAIINSVGDVVHARVLRSQPLLDSAALDAVAQWQFQPTLVNGVPTPVIMTVTVNFVLE